MIEEKLANPNDHPAGTRFIGRRECYTSTLMELLIEEWSPSGEHIKVSGCWSKSKPIVHEVLQSKE